MIVLHNPSSLLHTTVELLGARLIPALECPERITAIVDALSNSSSTPGTGTGTGHTIHTIDFDRGQVEAEKQEEEADSSFFSPLITTVTATHSPVYIQHLSSIFQTWLSAGLVEPDSCILPECFALPRPGNNDGSSSLPPPSEPPKDIYARVGFYAFDMSSGINAHSYQAILGSANLALEGVKILFSKDQQQQQQQQQQQEHQYQAVLALTRPPGHHCDGARSGGYCYINNAAIAVTAYQQQQQQQQQKAPTAILDLDFHHGNGTQSIFYNDPSVLYVSIHGRDEFPYYTGSEAETGSGPGLGFNLNLPLDTNSSYTDYARLLDRAIQRIRQHAPSFLVISLGFDTFELDPLGKFAITTADYETMARTVRVGLMNKKQKKDKEEEKKKKQTNDGINANINDSNNTSAGTVADSSGPVEKALILLEGGYVVDRLGENMLSFLKGWEED